MPRSTIFVQTTVVLLWLAGSAFGQPVSATAATERGRELEAMVDALANRSQKSPPVMVERGQRELPAFDESYDAVEQQRVRKALIELNKQVGNELWPLLVAHADDKRYACTFEGDYRAENHTVGSLCFRMANEDLLRAYRLHVPDLDDLRNAEPERPYSRFPRLWPDDLLEGGFVKWARKHPDLEMYEAQIAICEWAVGKATSLEGISDKKKKQFVTDLTKQIATLKETKQPIVEKQRFRGEYYATISAKSARELREEAERVKATHKKAVK